MLRLPIVGEVNRRQRPARDQSFFDEVGTFYEKLSSGTPFVRPVQTLASLNLRAFMAGYYRSHKQVDRLDEMLDLPTGN